MKTLLGLISAIAWIAVASTARADHHEVFIHDIVLLDADTCAVELQIEENNQNGFEGTDRIEINGGLLASIGDTEAATINTGGHTNAGDAILFASNDFVNETGLTADIEFDDSNCSSFIPGSVFTFVIDDPAFGGPNKVIDTFTLPGGFITNVVAFRDSMQASAQLIGLDGDTAVITNNSGAEVVLGVNPDDNGGCRLAKNSAGHPEGWLIGAGLLSWLLLRKRRHVKAQ